MREYQLWMDGGWVAAKSQERFATLNPADRRDAVASYAQGGAEDARLALSAAEAAAVPWRKMTPVARGRILSKASQILESRRSELATHLTLEEGKTLAESTGEVQRAIDILRFFGGMSYVLGGQTLPHDLPGNLLLTLRQPLGVVALVTPWNFPIAIPAWKLAPALICGNAVVMKPASLAPSMTFELARALGEAGLPKGVLNVVTGEGRSVGAELATDARVAALSFTGSHGVGHRIHQQLAQRMARSQMEMGGKNPTIVLSDADLDLAASLVIRAGFGLTGQACTATSRVIVERSVMGAFLEKLIERARGLKVGNGLASGIDMGPVVSPEQLDANLAYVRSAVEEGAELEFGGTRLEEGDLAHGCFMAPAVLAGVRPDARIACEEVFGPVVAVLEAEDFEAALALANASSFGLSASLVTRDFRKAMVYAESIEAGVVKVNQISTGLALQAPFGGVKQSSTDTFKEQGATAIEFYSRLKTVYFDYSA